MSMIMPTVRKKAPAVAAGTARAGARAVVVVVEAVVGKMEGWSAG
jgi:hypothetical protein